MCSVGSSTTVTIEADVFFGQILKVYHIVIQEYCRLLSSITESKKTKHLQEEMSTYEE